MLDKFSCKRADKVIVVGRDMVETLKDRFLEKSDFQNEPVMKQKMPKYAYINNWINEKEIIPLSVQDKKVMEFKQKYGLQDKFVIMYSGNIGLYYDLVNIIKIIAKFENREDVVFAFVGAGSVLEELKEYCKKEKVGNIVFVPYQEKADLVYSLNAGDVHFVVNAKGIKGVSVPSKLYGVMAAGKAVLGILEKNSEARLIIEEAQCGISVDPGNYEAIEELIQRFLDLKDNRELKDMGENGRKYLVESLTKDVSIEKYRDEILSC